MKNTIIAVLVVALCLSLVFHQSHSQTKQKFEYKFAFSPNEKEVNKLAADGWELAAVDAGKSGLASNVATYIFKREK